jgi:hypothetical protein
MRHDIMAIKFDWENRTTPKKERLEGNLNAKSDRKPEIKYRTDLDTFTSHSIIL